ncbi:MAG TPA: tetratricopeptide repeat protein [Sediminibacterium sp.]|nr:tetratricopeptide repeat protein [Sediminibacterium sp.]
MKYCGLLLIALFSLLAGSSQVSGTKQLLENARILMQQGDYNNAASVLQQARQQAPLDLELLKNLSYVYYLQREFSNAIETGKVAVAMDSADQQAFQILGLSYKAIAAYKEANKLYRTALKKFPNSGMLYNELGECLKEDNQPKAAIELWEKGIQKDPNYSGNYYNAVKYHQQQQNHVRVLLYSELFVNLESYTPRTKEVKACLAASLEGLLKPGVINSLLVGSTLSAFERQVALHYSKNSQLIADELSIHSISSIRTRLVLDWYNGDAARFPYRLFDQWQYLIREGIFEAYNQWLLGEVVNNDAYQLWQNNHAKEVAQFRQFQQSRVFKMVPGQYYMQ